MRSQPEGSEVDPNMRRALLSLIALLLAASAPASAGEDCALELARVDEAGVGTLVAECRWPIAPRFVTDIVGNSKRLAEVSSSLSESTRLADGRIVNVHSPGWPIADRQSTLAIAKQPLAEGGLVLEYEMTPPQAPLGRGRVQARRDEGRWEIRSDGNGGARLRYESRYDPGGGLPLAIVRRTVRSSIAEFLGEIFAAARAAETKSARKHP